MDCGAAAPSVTLTIEGAVTAARLGGTGAGREGVREGLKAMSQRVATHAAKGLISSAASHVVRLLERSGSASPTS